MYVCVSSHCVISNWNFTIRVYILKCFVQRMHCATFLFLYLDTRLGRLVCVSSQLHVDWVIYCQEALQSKDRLSAGRSHSQNVDFPREYKDLPLCSDDSNILIINEVILKSGLGSSVCTRVLFTFFLRE